jgi:hypothetical protein
VGVPPRRSVRAELPHTAPTSGDNNAYWFVIFMAACGVACLSGAIVNGVVRSGLSRSSLSKVTDRLLRIASLAWIPTEGKIG